MPRVVGWVVKFFAGRSKALLRFGKLRSRYNLLKKINVPEEKAFVLLVNGLHKNLDVILSDGDRVSIFPAVGGG